MEIDSPPPSPKYEMPEGLTKDEIQDFLDSMEKLPKLEKWLSNNLNIAEKFIKKQSKYGERKISNGITLNEVLNKIVHGENGVIIPLQKANEDPRSALRRLESMKEAVEILINFTKTKKVRSKISTLPEVPPVAI